MRRSTGKRAEPGRPHSERAGEGLRAAGERETVYRALRELSCSRCGSVIKEGDLFTREPEPASGLPLLRRCRACVPFRETSGLLAALLEPEQEAPPAGAKVDVREKVLSRLGPALAARRRRDDR